MLADQCNAQEEDIIGKEAERLRKGRAECQLPPT